MCAQNLLEHLRSYKELKNILQENTSEFISQPLYGALAELLKEKKLTRAQVIHNSMLNAIYAQQIFIGVQTERLRFTIGKSYTVSERQIQ